MRRLLMTGVLLLLLAGRAAGASAFHCGQPLADVAARFLPGKSAEQAARAGALPPCFHVVRLQGAEAVAITGPANGGAVAWRTGRHWVIRPARLSHQPITGGSFAFAGGEPDVFLMVAGSHLLHGGAGSTFRFQPVTEPLGRAEFEFLRHDLALVTHAGEPDGPLAWTGSAWRPANAQRLLRWNGERFDEAGRRTFPEPALTANRFLGALQQGDLALAARCAASRAVTEKARRVLGPSISLWTDAEDTSPGSLKWQVRRSEMHHWALLPHGHRLPPLRTYAFPINRGGERVILPMTRTPDRGWIITDIIKRKAPGRLTATGASSRPWRGAGTGRAAGGSAVRTAARRSTTPG